MKSRSVTRESRRRCARAWRFAHMAAHFLLRHRTAILPANATTATIFVLHSQQAAVAWWRMKVQRQQAAPTEERRRWCRAAAWREPAIHASKSRRANADAANQWPPGWMSGFFCDRYTMLHLAVLHFGLGLNRRAGDGTVREWAEKGQEAPSFHAHRKWDAQRAAAVDYGRPAGRARTNVQSSLRAHAHGAARGLYCCNSTVRVAGDAAYAWPLSHHHSPQVPRTPRARRSSKRIKAGWWESAPKLTSASTARST